MKKLFNIWMLNSFRPLILTCFILASANNLFSQQMTTVLPNNATFSNRTGPQGALRYQRAFYLITPQEMSRTGFSAGMNVRSIGFTIGRAQSDTTQGRFRVFLQNSSNLVSRADTAWITVSSLVSQFNATGLQPGDYEWQVRANCSTSSAFTSSINFSNDDIAGCNAPYNLITSNISSGSVTFSWESISSPVFSSYDLEYKPTGSDTWTTINTTSTSVTASGLIADTNYQWRVKTNCTTGTSSSNSASFVTNSISQCDAPSSPAFSIANDTLVTLSWTAAPSALYYEVQFRRLGTNTWSASSSSGNSYLLNLADSATGTTYEWRVRSVCGVDSSSDFIPGSNFTTGGAAICYEPTNPVTTQISGNSAVFSWTPTVNATDYTIRYRLKNTISWTNAINGMELVNDNNITIPDTTGNFDIPFSGGNPFTYNGEGLYVAWEYQRPAGALTSANLMLSTSEGTSIPGVNGQDSIQNLLCMISRADTSLGALPEILHESKQRPETRLGSDDVKDSLAIIAVYALGRTAPGFRSPTPVSALVANYSAAIISANVTLTVTEKSTGAPRYSTSQNVSLPPNDSTLVSFNGWSPVLLETDSIIISVPAWTNENVVNNNSKAYLQKVTATELAYDDGSAFVSEAGFGTGAGLILTKQTITGCGQVLSAKVYLSESAKDRSLYAVVLDASGNIIAQSAAQTANADAVNKYQAFYFTNPPSLQNQDFYIGIAQEASANAYNPVGAQWEDAQPRSGAYYRADLNGSNLTDLPVQGRLMIRAELSKSGVQPFIEGSTTLCTGATNTLSVSSAIVRFANGVKSFSSQYSASDFSAGQTLGSPDVFPASGLNSNAWVSNTPDQQREYLELTFPNPGKINFVDIYETVNPGAVDSIFAWDAANTAYVLLYSATADSIRADSRRNRISFPLTSFDVSDIRIAINSPVVLGYNSIDAVGIGELTNPATFGGYSWSPGGETSATKQINSPGVYQVTVSNGAGCSYTDSIRVVAANTLTPVISSNNGSAICQGDSLVLSSSLTGGNTWSTGETTDQITVYTAGSYTVSYDDGAGCGAISSAPFNVTINQPPTVTISGSLDICIGNSIILDAGAGFNSYAWNTGESTQTISVSTAGIYSVRVTNANGCSNSASVTTSYAVLAPPVITGNLSFCPEGSTTLDAGSGYSSYRWSTGETTQTITVSSATVYSVTVTNAGGCSASASVNTSFFTSPRPQISGNTGFCAGNSTLLSATPGFASYSWSNTLTTPSITVSTAGLYSVEVTDNNGCKGSASASVIVYPNPVPVITGTLSFCGGGTTTLNAGPGYSAYSWSTSESTQTISVSTAGTFTVNVTNSNGCIATSSVTTTITGALPARPGAITGPRSGSCNTTGNVYSISSVPNTSHYVWIVPSGATIQTGQGTTSISVQFGPSFQGGLIEVAASNACGQSPSILPRTLTVRVLANQPGNITGPTSGVCGPTTRSYSIARVAGATSYTWTAPAGASVQTGQGTNSVTVLFNNGYTFGNLCVTANNTCGSSTPSCIQVTGKSPVPGTINGPSAVCSNQANLIYSIDPVPGATSYLWAVPRSANIVAGQGGTTIVVKWGPQAGNITVRSNSACGFSGISAKAITLINCFTGSSPVYVTSSGLNRTIRPVPEVISNYGGFATTDKWQVEWTLGETMVKPENNQRIIYTQGFHQPGLSIKLPVREGSDLLLADMLKLKVYPNPFSDVLNMQFESEIRQRLTLEVQDIYGRVIQKKQVFTDQFNETMIMKSTLPGTYFLVVRNEEGKLIKTIKLIKGE